jgi:mannose-1-phosphate guanylyltransferase
MKALLLIGGQATRLWPLSKTLPKSLLPVCDRELLLYQVSQLAYAGIHEIVLAAGMLAEQLQDYVRGFGGGLQFHLSIEPEPRGTAGAIAHARDLLGGDSVVVLNADILSDVRVADVIRHHFEAGRPATVVGYSVPDPARYGLLRADAERGLLHGFSEKPEGALPDGPHFINAGIYVLSPDAVAAIPEGRTVSIEREVFPRLIAEHEALGFYPHEGLWIDVGTFESYFRANFALLGRRYTFGDDQLWGQRDDCAVFKDFVYLHKSARLGADADLFHRVVVMRDCVVGTGAKLRNALLMPGAQVGAGAELADCIVGPGAEVMAQSLLSNMLLVEGEDPVPFFPGAVELG